MSADNTRIPMGASREEGKVSVIIPAYNAGAFLEETIASVKSQTYEHWEMVIANDGSTDNTVEIAEKAAAEDPRIHLYHVGEGKTGLAARTRNLAMSRARGEFFAFLDADDQWAPNKLERQVEYLGAHPNVAGVCTWSDLFGDEERVRREGRIGRTVLVVDKEELINSNCPFQTSSLMIRRRCYDEIGGMDEDPRLVSGQDYEYIARLIIHYEIHRMPEVLLHYRMAPLQGSLSTTYKTATCELGFRILEVMIEKGHFTPNEAQRKVSQIYYQQAVRNLFHLHAPFRRYLWRSIISGHSPLKAVVMFSLSFLPACVLWRTLIGMQKIVKFFVYRRFWRKQQA